MMSQGSYHEFEDLELFDDSAASVDDMFLASIAVNSTQSMLWLGKRSASPLGTASGTLGTTVHVDLRVPNCASEPVPDPAVGGIE